MTQHLVIAIDGTAASGKGTLARKLAERLNMAYLDTGKLYRYVGHRVLTQGGNPASEVDAVAMAQSLQGTLKPEDLAAPVLASDQAGKAASEVGQFPGVREALIAFQKDFAQRPPGALNGAILDGRDIGTVICPGAPIKFYVTADIEIRAQRRFKELQLSGIPVTYEAVLEDMRARDARDAGRKAAPMKPAEDAIMLDTSAMGIDEVLETALAHIAEKAPTIV